MTIFVHQQANMYLIYRSAQLYNSTISTRKQRSCTDHASYFSRTL